MSTDPAARHLYAPLRFRIAGDRGLLVDCGDAIDPAVNDKVRALKAAARQDPIDGVTELIPSYRSLLALYDPLRTDPDRLQKDFIRLEQTLTQVDIPVPDIVDIPVCYGGEFGPDIEFVARHNRISVDEVIRLHTGPCYRIYMIGFAPGFPYLGGLPESLHTPRLETPRPAVAAGSVGIANNQTGMYTVQTPGGWRIIGRTPLRLFDPDRSEPVPYQAGDQIRFKSISRQKYQQVIDTRGMM
ncbi:MAG: allophanate hydrolase subunit 1 [Deltaproteobacteria bacterium]|nr:MAG: allophanate hydrolase subunit 1 [Deltaproteobacteria bacterium]